MPLFRGGFAIDVARHAVGALRGEALQQFRAQAMRGGIVAGHFREFPRQLWLPFGCRLARTLQDGVGAAGGLCERAIERCGTAAIQMRRVEIVPAGILAEHSVDSPLHRPVYRLQVRLRGEVRRQTHLLANLVQRLAVVDALDGLVMHEADGARIVAERLVDGLPSCEWPAVRSHQVGRMQLPHAIERGGPLQHRTVRFAWAGQHREAPVEQIAGQQRFEIGDEDVLQRFKVDAIELGRAFAHEDKYWAEWVLPDGTPCLMPAWAKPERQNGDWVLRSSVTGIPIARMPEGVWYFDPPELEI